MPQLSAGLLLALLGFGAAASQSLHCDGKDHTGTAALSWVLLHGALWAAAWSVLRSSPVAAGGLTLGALSVWVYLAELNRPRLTLLTLWLLADLTWFHVPIPTPRLVYLLGLAAAALQFATVLRSEIPSGVAPIAWVLAVPLLGVFLTGYGDLPWLLAVLPALFAALTAAVVTLRCTANLLRSSV